MKPIANLIARVLIAQVFILAGISKIGTGYTGVQEYMNSVGVPSELLPLVIFIELGGGIALALGFLTRWTALILAVFTIIAAVLFHANFSDQMQVIAFTKNIAISGGLLLLMCYGGDKYSLDVRQTKDKTGV
ncbi:DoxX family protein [Candidatus Nitrosacidococcus tergens]|uniref:Putative quinol oxidase subunit n=1 Tax=Candidatus Nitrosacidococcus tergens TaxID=553981 RepID=A0A7G1Q704_9GAMM|nr:DoxX family protein [Candidatus Nitrosacidococcus tergens]CAB1274166.1 putative quinol oxidase subunit [Candidatus Nitrosacidococcus tergens]